MHHVGTVRMGGDFGIMGDDHHRVLGVAQALEQGQDLLAGARIERTGRFVGEQDGRPVDQRARDRDPLLLATGHLAGEVAGAAAQADRFQRRLRAFQPLAIARALVNRPPILLADEPTGALDSRTGEEILALFKQLREDDHTVILITHDPGVAAHADRTYEMRDGELHLHGSSA